MCNFVTIKDAVKTVSLSDKMCTQGSQLSMLMVLAAMTGLVPSNPIPGDFNDPHLDVV